MPPFRAGLLKRKGEESSTEKTIPITNREDSSNDENDSGSGTEDLLQPVLHEDGDDTDDDGDLEFSDHEEDGVLFQDGDNVDSTLGEDVSSDAEVEEEDAEDSSDLTDSEDGEEESDDENEGAESSEVGEGSSADNDSAEDEDSVSDESVDELGDNEVEQESDYESGIGQTHSEASADEPDSSGRKTVLGNTRNANKKLSKTKPIKKDSTKKVDTEQVTTAVQKQDKKQATKTIIKDKPKKEIMKTKKNLNKDVKNKDKTAIEKLQVQIDNSHISEQKDEYASGDSSDEEDRRNTVGDVPMWWYNDYPHIGYNLDGQKLIKPPQRDQIEEFLKKCEDPDFWRTVRDPSTGQDVVLSREDLELIARIKQGRAPSADHDEYAPWIEWFSSVVLKTPVRAFPEHKRSFLPSQSEQKKISKLVHALKMGWIKTRKQEAEERRKKKERQFYNLWGSAGADEEARLRGVHKHIPAPRRPLPSHAESYNPPPEYLLDAKEMKEWNKLKTTPWKRKYTFLPTQFASLRAVPAYERYTRERFLRCLDLYLAPRAIKMRLTIEPSDLVPKLPSPRDLQPFPTAEALVFRGHTDMVRSIDTDPSGQYLVSGSDDATIKVWEVSTGRCLRTVTLAGPVRCVAWTPVEGLTLVAACSGTRLMLINPGAGIGDHRVAEKTDLLLEEPPPSRDVIVDERTATAAQWERVAPEEWVRGVRVAVNHFKEVKHVQWHGRGDYLCCTLPEGASRAVLVHQLSRRRSQLPFSKAKGLVQCALFHPVRPFLFVATQRVVRVYDLVKQELVRKLLTGAQWISTMAMHPAGDNLLVASYDRKMMWFDLDLSSKPYQTLRLHGTAVRAVAFHKRYPLFASAGDDLKVIVSHGMVYNDLLQSPLLVPLKQLWGHERRDDLGVLDLRFHPHQPWVFSAGADHTVRLFT